MLCVAQRWGGAVWRVFAGDSASWDQAVLVATVDIGSSVVKAAIVDPDGTIVGHAAERTRVNSAEPGEAELDARDLVEAPIDVLTAAIARSGARVGDVASLAVTGARGTVVGLDRAGVPVGRAMMWTDTRSVEELDAFVGRCGGRAHLVELTGLIPDTTLSAPAIMRWRRRSAPSGSATYFAGPQAAALLQLTGTLATDYTNAAHYGLAALAGTRWEEMLCAAAGVDPRSLPTLVPPGAVVGSIASALAERIGLAQGIPVLAAGSDATCYKLGAGVVKAGEGTLSIGTSATCAMLTAEPSADPAGLLSCTAAATPGLWEVFGIQPSGAAMLEWLRALVAGPDDLPIGDLIREAEPIAPGADGLVAVPYLMGAGVPQNDAAAAMFAGLRPLHGRAHLVRAVLEGVAFSLRMVLEALEAVGHRPTLLRLVGGAARSQTWAQILADVVRRPLETVEAEEPGLVGAAMFGAVGTGIHPDLPTAVRSMARVRRRHEPRPQSADAYAGAYRRFKDAAASARTLANPHMPEP